MGERCLVREERTLMSEREKAFNDTNVRGSVEREGENAKGGGTQPLN